LASFFIIYKSCPRCRATFIHGNEYALILTKMGRPTFWAIISKIHRVTLAAPLNVPTAGRECVRASLRSARIIFHIFFGE
jgi:hypothetical protein